MNDREQSSMGKTLLEVRGLRLETRGDKPIRLLDDISLQVSRGEVLALVGESGCGKTLTSLATLGLHPDTTRIAAGSIKLDGQELAGASETEYAALRGRQAAVIFQDPASALNPAHRIGRVLAGAVMRHRGWTREEARREAVALLERVGIPQPERRLGTYPHQFSGGMNQRVMIALALSGQPDLLIADEPTTALDVTTQRQILDLLAGIQSETGMAMIFISHDLGVVAGIAQRVAVMYCGRIVEEGPVDLVFRSPAHPYTAGLLASMPPDPTAETIAPARPIPGMVAPLSDLPEGCHFHPRCDRAGPACREGRPPLREFADGQRKVLCHFPLGAEA